MPKRNLLTPLAKLLEEQGRTNQFVASKLGTSRAVVSAWTNGRKIPNDKNKRRLAALLDATVQELFYDEVAS